MVLVTFHTLPVGRSGPYFILLFTYIGEQKYEIWARSAHGKCVKSDQNHQKNGAMSEMVRELRNEASGLGFFMFFIGAKNKKSNFFFEMISNHSKMVPNTPKLYLNVILVCFTVIGGLISVILTILVIFGQKL